MMLYEDHHVVRFNQITSGNISFLRCSHNKMRSADVIQTDAMLGGKHQAKLGVCVCVCASDSCTAVQHSV